MRQRVLCNPPPPTTSSHDSNLKVTTLATGCEALPVKLLTITIKSLHDDAPEYVQNLVNRYHPRRQLRSVNDTLCTPNRNRTVIYGRRLMDTAAASLWNTLPIDIKNALNIVSFKEAFKNTSIIIDIIARLYYIYIFFNH